MTGRAKTGGVGTKARRRKGAKVKRVAKATSASRSHSLTVDLQQQLDKQAHELAEVRRQLAEALEQQSATSEVLKVISSSSGDLQPVFKAMLQNALHICEASFGILYRYDGECFVIAAQIGASARFLGLMQRGPMSPHPDSVLGRIAVGRNVVEVADATKDPGYLSRVPAWVAGVEEDGTRSLLAVPMKQEHTLVGAFVVFRKEIRPFTSRQIELLKNFAAQAVIAIDNARLLNELRQRTDDLTESLEQQTATSEVLKVISSSPGDLQPVFQAILENATRICDAGFGVLFHCDENGTLPVAWLNLPPPFEDYMRQRERRKPRPGTDLEILWNSKQPIHTLDMLATSDASGPPVRLGGARTELVVPMLKDDQLVGAIVIYRQEIRAFSEKQIELVQNFASQAVIAIENTRLLNELREALQQQTATSQVLHVISSSPGDLEPVFETMLENATRICDARFGVLHRYENGAFQTAAQVGVPPALAEYHRKRGPYVPPPEMPLGRILQTKKVLHTVDQAAAQFQAPSAKLAGARTHIAVPMLKEDEVMGAITIYRTEVRPFTDKQIALLQNFAAQAVIAIENTRLLNELRWRTTDLSEALGQQTATSEVLGVIARSSGKLEPIFQTLLANALRICDAKFGAMFRFEGEENYPVAELNSPPALKEWLMQRGRRRSPAGQSLHSVWKTKQVCHITDDVTSDNPSPPARLAGARTHLAVPMLKDDELIGAIVIYRQEVRSFTEKQIDLLKNFASQAVIAIENTRLLSELRESLQQQTATADVLRVISSSPGELNPVFDSLLSNATNICDAKFGNLFMYRDGAFTLVAMHNAPTAYAEARRRAPVRPPLGTGLGQVAITKQVAHVTDLRAEQVYIDRDPFAVQGVELGGIRTLLAVPMLKDGELVGAIVIYRQEVRPFTDKQIELVQNFAAQAVIAIENTRLLNELRQRTDDLTESLEQQTATSDVLHVISSSPGELGPVFQVMLENATRICEAKFGTVFRYDGDLFHQVASIGTPPALVEFLTHRGPLGPEDVGIILGHLYREKTVATVADEQAIPKPGPSARYGGARSVVGVPMLKEDILVGAIVIYRQEVRPFTDKQIELVQNFAAQAVIAIENARLLNELRQRTDDLSEALEQQTATSEVLGVISRSPGELKPVFNAILENATRICEAQVGNLFLFEGDSFRAVAVHGESSYADWFRREPVVVMREQPGTPLDRLTRAKKVIHIPDLREDQSYLDGSPRIVSLVETAGARTHIVVPMLKEGELVGAVVIYRDEVRPFSARQIDLLTNFAAQAVIAIENARLLNELRQRTDDLTESLAQQTATSEVLEVISRSPGDLDPVFQSILDNAAHICEAKLGNLLLREGNNFRMVAVRGEPDFIGSWSREPLFVLDNPDAPLSRATNTRAAVHIADLRMESNYVKRRRRMVDLVDKAGARTLVSVPMLKDNEVIGVIAIYRQEVRPFTDKQIALLQTFAAQAVIAIDNTRLLNELRQRTGDLSEALEQQTATSEVLKVISSSSGNLQPVFDSVLKNATGICGAGFGMLWLSEGDGLRPVAMHGVPSALAEERAYEGVLSFGPDIPLGRVMITRQLVHVADIREEPGYVKGFRPFVRLADVGGARTLLVVPMVKDDDLVGAIAIYRQEVRAFSDKQIELVKNFADQAVIAIENTRLLGELRESLQQQTATSDVLKVISRSTFDLQAVFDTLIESAARLCRADRVAMRLLRDDAYHTVAMHGYSAHHFEYMRNHPASADRTSIAGRVVLEGKPVHIIDVQTDPELTLVKAAPAFANIRSLLGIPLLREGTPIGMFILAREMVEPFTENQIELVQTFADQAVIAIENVRLFESVEARTRELAKSLEDLRTAQDRLVQTEKLASLGQLTAGIAHEIKNPLNFVNNFSAVSVELIDELREALAGAHLDSKLRAEIAEIADMLQGNLDKIVQHGKRADSIVKNMLLHSREGSGERRPVDINAVVEESLNLAYHGARAEKQGFNITLERSFDPAAGEAEIYPQEIARVLLNLISNGFYAATKRKADLLNGDYEPILSASTKSLGDQVEIRIRDNGIGIPTDVKDKMFNPFFTTKPVGEGTGLGLSISHDIIVKQHAGSIEVETEPGQFTEFRIVLPRNAGSLSKSGGQT